MIAFLEGTVFGYEGDQLILLTGGIGFAVHVTPKSFGRKHGERIQLYISTQFSEEGMNLFGFSSLEEKLVFEALRKTSGVGSKKALSILSIFDPGEVVDAILNDQWQLLARTPGIGQKTAKRIVLELKDKVKELAVQPRAREEKLLQLQGALEALGYTASEVSRAVDTFKDRAKEMELSDLIREAIGFLSRRGK